MADGYLGTESRDLRFCSISLEGLDSNARLTDFISLKSEISINPAVTLALIHVRGTKIKETQQNRACHSFPHKHENPERLFPLLLLCPSFNQCASKTTD